MALFNVFRAENYLHIEIKWVRTGKKCVAMGTKCFIAVGVFSVELLLSLPSFNGLRCKLAKIALLIYMMLFWVEYMTSSVISFAYFTHFSNLISPEPMQVFANGKRRFHSFILIIIYSTITTITIPF